MVRNGKRLVVGLMITGVALLARPVAASTPPGSEAPTTTATPTTEPPVLGENTDIGPEVSVPVQQPPLISETQVVSAPLIVVPAGCTSPTPARAVFVGTVERTGLLPGTEHQMARFTVSQVRAGTLDGYEVDRSVDILFDDDIRFLDAGSTYVVGAAIDQTSQLLASKVREPAPLFGGDAVIGLNDSDVECPVVEDPVRTIRPDGSPVDTGVLTPLSKSKNSLARAVLVPLAIAFAALVVLAAMKLLAQGMLRSLFGHHQPASPVSRTRRHAPADPATPPPT